METTLQPRTYTTDVIAGPVCKMLSVEWSEVIAIAGTYSDVDSTPKFLVSAREYVRLWNAIIARSDVPNVSRMLGERIASGPAIPVLFSMSSAPDYATGLDRLVPFKHIFGPLRLAISKTNVSCSIRVVPDDPAVDLPATFSSSQIVFLHAKARSLSVRTFQPVSVNLPLPIAERENLIDLFGQIPDFGEPTITYRSSDMDIPFISSNPELWEATEADLQSLAKIVAQGHSISERVRAVLIAAFGVTNPTLSHVCDRLAMSRSTLLRKLRSEGLTFQAMLDQTRQTLAIRYLRTGDLTNQQIAHLTGYTDANAFQRAFKKWTGTTPGDMRERVRTIGSGLHG